MTMAFLHVLYSTMGHNFQTRPLSQCEVGKEVLPTVAPEGSVHTFTDGKSNPGCGQPVQFTHINSVHEHTFVWAGE